MHACCRAANLTSPLKLGESLASVYFCIADLLGDEKKIKQLAGNSLIKADELSYKHRAEQVIANVAKRMVADKSGVLRL